MILKRGDHVLYTHLSNFPFGYEEYKFIRKGTIGTKFRWGKHLFFVVHNASMGQFDVIQLSQIGKKITKKESLR